MFDIDYREYLSIDNGNGLLFSKYEVSVLKKYGFLICEYNSYGSLIFDVNDYLDSCVDDCEDLEDVLISISEKNYYYNRLLAKLKMTSFNLENILSFI